MTGEFEDRVKCWLLGSALGGATDRLVKTAFDPDYLRGNDIWGGTGVERARLILKEMNQLFNLAGHECGIEPNGFLQGEFAVLEKADLNDQRKFQEAVYRFGTDFRERQEAAKRGESDL